MIRIVVTSDLRTHGRPGEDLELQADAQWDLATAVDMCHRIDRLFRERGTYITER